MTIDLKHPDGKQIIRDMLVQGHADVMIENFMPSKIRKL